MLFQNIDLKDDDINGVSENSGRKVNLEEVYLIPFVNTCVENTTLWHPVNPLGNISIVLKLPEAGHYLYYPIGHPALAERLSGK